MPDQICKPCKDGQQVSQKHRAGSANLAPHIRRVAKGLHNKCLKKGCVCKHAT
jgi:hypothetical protein